MSDSDRIDELERQLASLKNVVRALMSSDKLVMLAALKAARGSSQDELNEQINELETMEGLIEKVLGFLPALEGVEEGFKDE